MFQNLVTPTDYPLQCGVINAWRGLGIGGDIVVVVKGCFAGGAAENQLSFSNQSCQQKENRMDRGRRRRWIVEGESLRGENEMEWDSDRDGKMDTESKTVQWRKFDIKSRECKRRGVRNEGTMLTAGVMSRHMEICNQVLGTERQGMGCIWHSPLLIPLLIAPSQLKSMTTRISTTRQGSLYNTCM